MKKKIYVDLINLAEKILTLDENTDIETLSNISRTLYERASFLYLLEKEYSKDVFAELSQQFLEKNKVPQEEVIKTHSQEDIQVTKKSLQKRKKENPSLPDMSEFDTGVEFERVSSYHNYHKPLKNKPLVSKKTSGVKFESTQKSSKTTKLKAKDKETLEEILSGHTAEPTFIKRSIGKQASLKELYSKNLDVGVHKKLDFIKNLFDNSIEDYLRVISQVQTMGNFSKAKKFITDVVKPDYNNWEEKEPYEKSFLTAIEKQFNSK